MSMVRIKYTEILKAVAKILRDKFGKAVYDVVEGFPRACFMTDLHISETSTIMSDHIKDDMTLTIYYFPENKHRNTAENLTMQENIRDLIFIELNGLIPVTEGLPLEVMDYRGAIVEDVLQVQIDLTMNHKIVIEDDRVMEELEVEIDTSQN